MKKIIMIAAVIGLMILGLAMGPALVNYKGYFLIVLEGGTFQLSIFGLIFCLIALFVFGWLAMLLIRRLLKMVSGSQDWLFGFGERKRQKAFATGLISLAEGNYEVARKNLLKVENHDFDGVNLLALAEAEAQSGNTEKARDIWFRAAENKKTALAAHLCIVRDLLTNNKCEQALTHLNQIPEKLQGNDSVVRLWAKALALSGKYQLLNDKLPSWKKALGEHYEKWQLEASKGTFSEIASREGANQLKIKWQSLPKATRKEPAQRAAYAQQLIDQRMYEEAERVLVEGQKSAPNPILFEQFRQLKNPHPTSAIRLLESWLKRDDSNVELLSVLGELSYNNQDYLLAEKVLSKAIKLGNQKRDVLLLAKIKEAQKDNLHALELYKKSVS